MNRRIFSVAHASASDGSMDRVGDAAPQFVAHRQARRSRRDQRQAGIRGPCPTTCRPRGARCAHDTASMDASVASAVLHRHDALGVRHRPLDVVDGHVVGERNRTEADPTGGCRDLLAAARRSARRRVSSNGASIGLTITERYEPSHDAFHLAVERADHVHRRCHVGGHRPAAHLPEHEVVRAQRHDFHVTRSQSNAGTPNDSRDRTPSHNWSQLGRRWSNGYIASEATVIEALVRRMDAHPATAGGRVDRRGAPDCAGRRRHTRGDTGRHRLPPPHRLPAPDATPAAAYHGIGRLDVMRVVQVVVEVAAATCTGPALTTADRVPSATAQCSTNERSNVNDWPSRTNPNRYSHTGTPTTTNSHQHKHDGRSQMG